MPKLINVVMMIEPVAKGRAKMTTFGGHARAYTPAKTRNAEAEVRISIRENLKHHLQWDIETGTYFPAKMPLRMEAMFVIPRPPSIPTFYPNFPSCVLPPNLSDISAGSSPIGSGWEKFSSAPAAATT